MSGTWGWGRIHDEPASELLLCLERGFTLPLKTGVSEGKVQPRQGREIKTRDPADLELLTDRKKEDAWEARIKLDDTPFAADDVWVAPAFVAKKRIFQHCDFREPRVVTGFNESINDFLVTPSFALITAGDIIQGDLPRRYGWSSRFGVCVFTGPNGS